MDLCETPTINLQENQQVKKLLESCAPNMCLDGEGAFLEFWGGIRDALMQIANDLASKHVKSALPN